MNEQYYYVIAGKRGGPTGFEALQVMAVEQELGRNDRVWCKGMKEWQPAGSVTGLFDDLPPDLASEEESSTPPPLPQEEPAVATRQSPENIWAQPPPPHADSATRQFMKKERQSYIVGYPIGVGFAGLAGYFADQNSAEFSSAVCALLGGAAIILAVVSWMRMHYRLWALLPPAYAKTSPGKAVGFYFIPLFNAYWCFVSFNGLASSANKTLAALKDKGLRCNEGLALAFSTAQACSLCLGAIVPLLGLLSLAVSYALWIVWYADLAQAFVRIEQHAQASGRVSSAALQAVPV